MNFSECLLQLLKIQFVKMYVNFLVRSYCVRCIKFVRILLSDVFFNKNFLLGLKYFCVIPSGFKFGYDLFCVINQVRVKFLVKKFYSFSICNDICHGSYYVDTKVITSVRWSLIMLMGCSLVTEWVELELFKARMAQSSKQRKVFI